jgi:hypothetical protein
MAVARPGVLGRRMEIIGWLCAFGTILVIFDLGRLLLELPTEWWRVVPTVAVSGHGMDLRMMFVDFFVPGWIGSWGYMAAFVWVPTATLKAWLGRRRGASSTRSERLVFGVVCALLCATSALVHLTPLRYPQYNIPLL